MLTERPTRCIPMKIIWITLGCLCLILGTIGIVFPILPTVPFYMLTGFCFARSSPKLLNWFYQTKLYHNYLETFIQKRTGTWKTKCTIVGSVTILMCIGAFFMRNMILAMILLGLVWIAHVVYFFFILKTEPTNHTL
ncbi:YbaN family protein [uncultured Megasphaera sp.]|uniref:YbaN family protein n=1 Tax=uncultured Megasphaera sp. TaxID=165188 RepID=UPI002597FBFD|nr:YbaN family protein [uncultured Megasphaera sp.]